MLPLEKEGILFDASVQSPPPSKDYVNICITFSNECNDTDLLTKKYTLQLFDLQDLKVVWRQWKINPHCLRPDVKVSPIEKKESHQDFVHDSDLQTEVKRVFGEHMLDYILGLCKGNYDYISRISDPLQIYIISFLELEDIGHLAQTSKHFHKICDSDQLWEHFVERHCDTVTEGMKQYASEVGWKHVFFTNKLQLQAQMRRHQQRARFAK